MPNTQITNKHYATICYDLNRLLAVKSLILTPKIQTIDGKNHANDCVREPILTPNLQINYANNIAIIESKMSTVTPNT